MSPDQPRSCCGFTRRSTSGALNRCGSCFRPVRFQRWRGEPTAAPRAGLAGRTSDSLANHGRLFETCGISASPTNKSAGKKAGFTEDATPGGDCGDLGQLKTMPDPALLAPSGARWCRAPLSALGTEANLRFAQHLAVAAITEKQAYRLVRAVRARFDASRRVRENFVVCACELMHKKVVGLLRAAASVLITI